MSAGLALPARRKSGIWNLAPLTKIDFRCIIWYTIFANGCALILLQRTPGWVATTDPPNYHFPHNKQTLPAFPLSFCTNMSFTSSMRDCCSHHFHFSSGPSPLMHTHTTNTRTLKSPNFAQLYYCAQQVSAVYFTGLYRISEQSSLFA